MDFPTLDTLRRRIEKLERDFGRRRWTFAYLALLGVLAIGAVRSQVIVEPRMPPAASRLVLQDNTGRLRAHMGVNEQDIPILTFLNRAGNERATIGLSVDGGSAFWLADQNNRDRLAIGSRPDGVPGLSLFGRNGTVRAELGSTDGESWILNFREKNQENRLLLQAGGHDGSSMNLVNLAGGHPLLLFLGSIEGRDGFDLWDRELHYRVEVGTNRVGNWNLLIQASAGAALWQVPIDQD
jgi:hypothetical protein